VLFLQHKSASESQPRMCGRVWLRDARLGSDAAG